MRARLLKKFLCRNLRGSVIHPLGSYVTLPNARKFIVLVLMIRWLNKTSYYAVTWHWIIEGLALTFKGVDNSSMSNIRLDSGHVHVANSSMMQIP